MLRRPDNGDAEGTEIRNPTSGSPVSDAPVVFGIEDFSANNCRYDEYLCISKEYNFFLIKYFNSLNH